MIDTEIIGVLALLNLFLGAIDNKESRFNLIVGAILALMFIVRVI